LAIVKTWPAVRSRRKFAHRSISSGRIYFC
jgi:hypothetical protein